VMAHWLVSAAARGGLGDVSSLEVADDAEIREAWLRVCGELGINPQRLAQAVAQATRTSLADLSDTEPEAMTLLPEKLARQFLVMPLRATYRELMVATSQPLDVEAEKEIGFVSGRRPVFEVATPHEIEDAINLAFSSSSERSPMGDIELNEAHAKVQPAPEAMAMAPDGTRDEGVIKLNRLVIYEAALEKVVEIHLTPGKSVGRVQFKVDGKLKTFLSLPLDTLAMMVARLRGMAELTDTSGLAVGGFEVRIDRQPHQLTVQTVPGYANQLILGLNTDLSAPMNPLAPTARSHVSHGDGSSFHILVVDDDEGQRLLMRSVLEKSGFRVTEADDGTTAFPVLEGDDEVDAVLLDLMMEHMDGLETLEKIRRSRSLAVLPVVILTASEDSKNELKLLRAGADDYLRKPVDPRTLVQRMNAVIRRVKAFMA
jgi:CheY-like chemotaxis protein